MSSSIERAREARSEYAAERAAHDPERVLQAVRIVRHARRLGVIDRDLRVVDGEQARRDRAAEAIQ